MWFLFVQFEYIQMYQWKTFSKYIYFSLTQDQCQYSTTAHSFCES